MKKKLTITVDADILPMAKRYTGMHGASLSSLFEQSLKDILDEEEKTSFSIRWRGQFQPAQRQTSRYDRLARKHM